MRTEEPEVPVHAEFPKMLYKLVPIAPDPPPPAKPTHNLESRVVADADEETKAEGEGWQKDLPKENDKPAHAHQSAHGPAPQMYHPPEEQTNQPKKK